MSRWGVFRCWLYGGHHRVMVVDAWGLDGATRYVTAMHPECTRCRRELVDSLILGEPPAVKR